MACGETAVTAPVVPDTAKSPASISVTSSEKLTSQTRLSALVSSAVGVLRAIDVTVGASASLMTDQARSSVPVGVISLSVLPASSAIS